LSSAWDGQRDAAGTVSTTARAGQFQTLLWKFLPLARAGAWWRRASFGVSVTLTTYPQPDVGPIPQAEASKDEEGFRFPQSAVLGSNMLLQAVIGMCCARTSSPFLLTSALPTSGKAADFGPCPMPDQDAGEAVPIFLSRNGSCASCFPHMDSVLQHIECCVVVFCMWFDRVLPREGRVIAHFIAATCTACCSAIISAHPCTFLPCAASSGGLANGCVGIEEGARASVAIVERGTCNFLNKTLMAQAVNASGLLIANSKDILDDSEIQAMACPGEFSGLCANITVRSRHPIAHGALGRSESALHLP
jgi:hypothetical protein